MSIVMRVYRVDVCSGWVKISRDSVFGYSSVFMRDTPGGESSCLLRVCARGG